MAGGAEWNVRIHDGGKWREDGEEGKKNQFFAKYHWAPQMADNDTGVMKAKL